MPMMMVDQLGECFRIGFVTNVQRCKPIELPGSCAGAGFRHLRDAEIDAVGEYGGEQQKLIFRRLAGLQMSEVFAEPGPAVDLQEQVGDFDMWKQSVCAAHQNTRFVGYGIG